MEEPRLGARKDTSPNAGDCCASTEKVSFVMLTGGRFKEQVAVLVAQSGACLLGLFRCVLCLHDLMCSMF